MRDHEDYPKTFEGTLEFAYDNWLWWTTHNDIDDLALDAGDGVRHGRLYSYQDILTQMTGSSLVGEWTKAVEEIKRKNRDDSCSVYVQKRHAFIINGVVNLSSDWTTAKIDCSRQEALAWLKKNSYRNVCHNLYENEDY